MAESRHPRWAWAWAALLLVLALALGGAAQQGRVRVNTDVLAMLPKDERQPEVERALAALARAGDGRIAILVEAPQGDFGPADRLIGAVHQHAPQARLRHRLDEAQAAQALADYRAHSGALLTPAQRREFEALPPEALARQALAGLMQPMGALRGAPWAADPFNTLGRWLEGRAKTQRARVQDGRLVLPPAPGEAHPWALLMLDSAGSAFALADNEVLAQALAAGRAAAAPARVVAAGVPLHAHAAASQAQQEMHAIGVGSLLGVFALSWLAFARLRPRVLVLLSVGSGLLVAVAATAALFGELHLITLVFGASLVGVAENYASSYYAARVDRTAAERFAVMREQLPTMGLALTTTLAGYALLATTPFPGLQQVAVFSAAGLAAAFVSTVLWFPHLDAGAVPQRALTRALGRLWSRWPTRAGWLSVGALAVAGLGLSRVQVNDDIRLLQSTPPALMQEQTELARRLELPSPAQFFLLSADSESGLLRAEEGLKQRLSPLVGAGQLQGWQAVSDWVPSAEQQRADSALVHRRWTEVAPLLAAQLGQAVPPLPEPGAVLTVKEGLAPSWAEGVRVQWLGADAQGRWHSVLLLRGLSAQGRLQAAALADGAGVRWVDKVADVSALLARQRARMTAVLGLATVAVAALLAWRFGRGAWRALLPTLLAGAVAIGVLGLTGQPLQLFHVLALLLLLGVGVDYGIFLLAQPDRQDPRAFLSVSLAAACTWLSFGLLALSATPALRAFGWTLGLGVVLAWGLTPFFMPVRGRV